MTGPATNPSALPFPPPTASHPPPPAGEANHRRQTGGRVGTARTILVALVGAVAGAAAAIPAAHLAVGPALPTPPVAELVVSDDLPAVSVIADQVFAGVVRVDVASGPFVGSGSGVVYSEQGHILTNAHVVGEADRVEVTLSNGVRRRADVVGTDEISDIAVLKVDVDGLFVPTFATDEPTLGEPAVAIGSPFGLDGSVTSGVVSSVGRTIEGPESPLVEMIQTDAAINPGNSGGALVNRHGHVIGINTAILTDSDRDGSIGIGFAVPASTARQVADELIAGRELHRGWLGVEGRTLQRDIGQTDELGSEGALLVSVENGSPADQSGLEAGDVIVAVGDVQVGSMTELAQQISGSAPGDTVTLTFVRDGQQETVDVALTSRDR